MGMVASDQLPKDHPQAVDVCLLAARLPHENLHNQPAFQQLHIIMLNASQQGMSWDAQMPEDAQSACNLVLRLLRWCCYDHQIYPRMDRRLPACSTRACREDTLATVLSMRAEKRRSSKQTLQDG